MKIEIDALRALAAQHRVPASEVTDAVTAALNTAYEGAVKSGAAHTDGTIELDTDGTVHLRTPDNAIAEPQGFGRIAVATVRQAVIAWVRDQERRAAVGPWADRENTVVEARIMGPGRNGELRLRTEGVTAVLPAGEQIAGEDLTEGSDIAVLILAANVDGNDNIKLTVSRRQPSLVTALLSTHAPALASGKVTVTSISREPGVRTKVALSAPAGVNAIEEVVGAGGFRIRPVAAVLGPEKIDLVLAHDDLHAFVAAALTPARGVVVSAADDTGRNVLAQVPPDQMAAAYGAEGINLRLAQRLTGTKIQLAPAS